MGDSTLQKFLRGITLDQYIALAGTYYDPEKSEVQPFRLWPRQAKAARLMGQSQFCAVPKRRQGGLSEITAERIIKSAMSYPKSEYVVLSATRDDAEYFLRRRIVSKLENLPSLPGVEWPEWEQLNKNEVHVGHSVIRSLPTTSNSGIGRTTTGVFIDECGAIDEQNGVSLRDLLANIIPSMRRAGDIGWLEMVGTSHPGSYWNEFVRNILDGKVPGFDLIFVPADVDPSFTPEFAARERLVFPSEMDFRCKYPMSMDDFFIVREGLVYPNFDPAEGGAHVKAFEPDPSWTLYLGYDHGFRHPAALLEAYHDKKNDILYHYREWYWRETGADVIAEYIKEILGRLGRKPQKMIADSAIFNQTGTIGVSEIFRRAGLYFFRSNKYGGKAIMDGSGALLGQRFTENKIVIHPQCKEGIHELANWRWDVKRKGEHPVDEGDETIDILRYLCAEIDAPDNSTPRASAPVRGYRDRAVKVVGRVKSWMAS